MDGPPITMVILHQLAENIIIIIIVSGGQEEQVPHRTIIYGLPATICMCASVYPATTNTSMVASKGWCMGRLIPSRYTHSRISALADEENYV